MTDKPQLATLSLPESTLALRESTLALPESALGAVPRVDPEDAEELVSVCGRGGARGEHRAGRSSPRVARVPRMARVARVARSVGGVEAEEVAALLLHKLGHDGPGNDEAAADTLEVRRAFLRYRFTDPLTAYEKGDRLYSHLDTVLNLTSIAAGIGASLLAASGSPKGWTIILGVAIAACQTFSQWLKPSKRAARRARAASELRSEAWNILQERDRYRGKDVDLAWDIFCNQVDKIEAREQTVEDTESDGLSSGGLGHDDAAQPHHR
jgi:hypothetical protein